MCVTCVQLWTPIIYIVCTYDMLLQIDCNMLNTVFKKSEARLILVSFLLLQITQLTTSIIQQSLDCQAVAAVVDLVIFTTPSETIAYCSVACRNDVALLICMQ